jgi:hypothetical protein
VLGVWSKVCKNLFFLLLGKKTEALRSAQNTDPWVMLLNKLNKKAIK